MINKLLIVPVVLVLSACGTPKIAGYEGPKALDRGAVISGARDCINGKMKPEVQYLSQKTPQGVVLVPVDVHCNVYTAIK